MLKNKERNLSKSISISAVFAALYALGVVFLAPISYQLIQLRLADALLPLTILFGWPAVLGVTIGCFVANVFGGIGIVDVIGGSVANFLAGLLAWKIGLKGFKGAWVAGILGQIIVIAVIVGSYLSVLFNMPLILGIGGLLASNAITIGIIGYILLKVLYRALHPTD